MHRDIDQKKILRNFLRNNHNRTIRTLCFLSIVIFVACSFEKKNIFHVIFVHLHALDIVKRKSFVYLEKSSVFVFPPHFICHFNEFIQVSVTLDFSFLSEFVFQLTMKIFNVWKKWNCCSFSCWSYRHIISSRFYGKEKSFY